ncbi:MAG: SsrA-binding protein SmpB [Phycisphaerae bacterium]|jgi:SsrA-binding protein
MVHGPPETPTVRNKKAHFNFEVLEKTEAGIALCGSEVKSLRQGRASLDEAFAVIRDGEVYLRGCNISPYPMASYNQHQPTRERKLLLHRRQIRKWEAKVTLRGLTLVPLNIYFNERGLAKVTLALARGKTHSDKRETLRKREHQRDMDRAMKRR